MKFFTKLSLLLLFAAGLNCCSVKEKYDSMKLPLSGDWFIKSSTRVKEGGEIISTDKFSPEGWYPAHVPTTVLNALVKDSVYPDPWIGLNNYKIPDVSDEFNQKYGLAKYSYIDGSTNPWKDPYWFLKEFKLPENFKSKKLWLNFDGINYRADVWLNGHEIAGRQEMVGMFLRFKYDITQYALVNKMNYLAVKIHQVDHPGIPEPGVQFEVFGKTRGHAIDIFKDETLKFSGGWDCAPVIRDRNMGIYQDVYITATGPVSIENPFVISDLPLPDTTRADIKITAELKNNSKEEVKGVLTIKISLINTLEFPTYSENMGGSMPDITIRKEVKLAANQVTEVELSAAEFPVLSIHNPYLWWPNGYGKQYLHNLELTFSINGKTSDKGNTTFGIREVTNELKKTGNEYGRVFYINGQRVFCKGGWLQPDALLNINEKRVYDEARLLAKANVNMVASEDAPSPPDVVLDSYDKYGLMCWETFYQCYRMFPGDTVTENNPADHGLALREAQDIIKRYRNHPSLVIWCAANEVTVAGDIYTPLRKYVSDLDGTRPFIPTSSISWDVDKLTPYIKADLPLGTTDDGDPDYNWNPERFYFDKILEVEKQTFRNELGVASVPVYSSLKKFIPKFSTDTRSAIFPLDSVWAEHGAWDDNNYAFRAYDNAIRSIYGVPASVEDYAKKAQFVNANSYRAMFEAANHRMWTITSGVMLWKLNDCWPSVLWQLYDWFLCQNASYYFAQKAMEPVHIQMNANNFIVSVINTRHINLDSLAIIATVVDFNMQTVWFGSEPVNIGADMYKELFSIPQGLQLTPVYFVKLELKRKDGSLLSENIYWLSSANKPDFSLLANLEPVALEMSASKEEKGKEYQIIVKLSNHTGKLSFFNRLVITRGESGEEVLPTFWDSNFITLFPGEEKTVRATIVKEDLHGATPYISIDGNNKVVPECLPDKEIN
ncbi:MAG: glycoside hydrolase family 2 [Bacteroidia bacterium]|nr:glycoside hydrolase family 2 [Bacteroidia bacterium]